MNVLSLFDGMSCGRIALDRLGIKVDNYYASEIDKYAMKVSEANYPDIIQVGDVTALDLSTLPNIDFIMGGSPCQGFSFAGKQLAFDDPRSALFFEFVKCVKELKPKYFLLENVRMKKEYLDVISEYMGVEPICINSALVSAQNRVRYYWTNIPGIEQPEQRGIVLRDILETNKSDILDNIQEKSYVIKAQYYKSSKANFEANNGFRATGIPQKPIQVGTAVDIKGHDILKRVYSENGKPPTVNAQSGGTAGSGNMLVEDKEIYWRKLTCRECERLQTVPDNYTNHVSNTQRYKMLGNGWTIEVIAHILKNMELNI